MSIAAPTQSFAGHVGYVLRQNPFTMIAFGMLGFLIFCAAFGPMLVPYDPLASSPRILEPPSLSHWFGTDHYGLDPDIMTIAKGLSSGYQPIGGSIIRESVAQVVEEGGEFYHGYTYASHPVAAAVALENIRILEDEALPERAGGPIGDRFAAMLASFADHPLVGEASVCGMMASLALTPDKAARAGYANGPGTAGPIGRDAALNNGIVMRHVYDRLVISPPLIMTTSEIDDLGNRVEKTLDDTLAKLKDDGLFKAA